MKPFKYLPNIYTANLPETAVQAAIAHAMADFPNESCGSIINGAYVAFKNESPEPERHFEIKDQTWFDHYVTGEVDCLVHSHNDCNYASVPDQTQRQELAIPSMIINLRQRSLLDCIVAGAEPEVPLLGRPFFYGVFDCLALVSDYMLRTRSLVLPNPPHEWEFWAKAENPIERYIDSYEGGQLFEVPNNKVEEGDILVYNMFGTKFINHMGVCVGDGLILHHFYNNVSGNYPISYGRKYLRRVMRLKQ